MTDPINEQWKKQERDARFSTPGRCAERLGSLEKRIGRRNLREYLAGGLIIAVTAAGFVWAALNGLYAYAIAALALMVGAALVLKHLHAHGRAQPSGRETPCLDHYRSQLVRQRDLLRSVPGWYLFPLVPGILAFYTASIMEATPVVGLSQAVGDTLMPLGWTIAFFLLVAWMNLKAARQLEKEIDALDGLTG